MDSLNFNSVETLPNLSARAAFQVNSSAVFKEDVDIVPVIIDDTLSYMPWGGDNNMPFDILKLIEDDETLSTCQMFNAVVFVQRDMSAVQKIGGGEVGGGGNAFWPFKKKGARGGFGDLGKNCYLCGG